MAVENITLNLIPTGDTPSIHVAQFDVERPFTVTLKEGADDFTPTGYDIELQVRKVDATIVTVLPTKTSGNVVTFNTTEQMTACSGANIAELQLTKDSQTFATLHFYLVVQRDVLAGGITSESDIYNLTEQIAAIVPEVIGDDYYNKEEVDEKIAEIPTFDPTNYYDKSDVNTLLNDKANTSDLSAVAFSGDYNDLENKPVIPDVSNYYTKTEVDTKITDLYQIKTASGSLVHITDGGDNIPVKSFECDIGSAGFSQADIVDTSENVFDMDSWLTSINENHTVSGNVITLVYITLKVFDNPCVISDTDKPFFLSVNEIGGDATGVRLQLIDSSNNVVAQVTNANKTASGVGCKIRIDYGNGGSAIFNNPIVSEQGAVYTVEFGATFNDGILKYENGAWYIDVSGVVTPITSSTRVKTISGENNIFSNTGDCEVSYFTEKSDGIAELIKAFM